ncbi:unnamed protein product [Phaedon cochleariae]|uniref:MADF domain-containing protein n=1 Tax=Phaedon cochleariae TaxID=80249 RepID=A0A9N9SCI8_PHACE|nr:unnamed protein product [Phaedon cochleariae]
MDANIPLLDSKNTVVDDPHHYDLPDSDTPSSPVRHTQDVLVAATDEAQCSSINTIQEANMPLLDSDDSVDDPHYLPDSDTSSDQPLSKIRRTLKKTSTHQSGEVAEVIHPDEQYTKRTGELKKRKKFYKTVAERNADKLEEIKTKHTVRTGCGSCKKGCVGKIAEDQRISINRDYWMMSWQERQIFLSASISTMEVKRRRGSGMSRTRSCKYFLKTAHGEKVEICKVFFLTTLGYNRKNDRAITNVINKENYATSGQDKRGKHPKTPKTDRSVIKTHIESFEPTISHYKREHAPNKRYLASDINITNMHKDFMAKHPDIKCSYELYRKCVSKDCNIPFTKLGHEECETCEIFKMHDPKHTQQNLIPDCESCKAWENHTSKANNAREKYRTDTANAGSDETSLIVSANLEKVIMLPRIDMFKQVELSLQQKKKVYDFADFVNCVQAANSGKVTVKEMNLGDFFVWPDNSSSHKIKQLIPRPYMKDIVEVIAQRGKNELIYRTSLDAELALLQAPKTRRNRKKNACVLVFAAALATRWTADDAGRRDQSCLISATEKTTKGLKNACVCDEMAESQRFGHSEKFISAFIEIFKQQKCLWMVKSKEYSNRIMKNHAYEELLNLYENYNDECDIDFVKRKIKSLRDSFRKEYKKVRATEKSGASTDDIYVPNLWYYKLLSFLKDQEVPRMGRDSDTQVEIFNDGSIEATENESQAEAESIPSEDKSEDESNSRQQETSTTDKVLPRKHKLKNGRAPMQTRKSQLRKHMKYYPNQMTNMI